MNCSPVVFLQGGFTFMTKKIFFIGLFFSVSLISNNFVYSISEYTLPIRVGMTSAEVAEVLGGVGPFKELDKQIEFAGMKYPKGTSYPFHPDEMLILSNEKEVYCDNNYEVIIHFFNNILYEIGFTGSYPNKVYGVKIDDKLDILQEQLGEPNQILNAAFINVKQDVFCGNWYYYMIDNQIVHYYVNEDQYVKQIIISLPNEELRALIMSTELPTLIFLRPQLPDQLRNPEEEKTAIYKGMMAFAKRDYETAVENLRKAVNEESQGIKKEIIYYYLGIALYEITQYDEAFQILKNAEKVMQNIAEYYYYLGEINYSKGDKTKAEENWKKSIQVGRNKVTGNTKQAEKAFKSLLGIYNEAGDKEKSEMLKQEFNM